MRPVRAIFTIRKMAFLRVLVGGVDSLQSQKRTVKLVWMVVCGLGNLASLHESERDSENAIIVPEIRLTCPQPLGHGILNVESLFKFANIVECIFVGCFSEAFGLDRLDLS
jgi:hypothetical protein